VKGNWGALGGEAGVGKKACTVLGSAGGHSSSRAIAFGFGCFGLHAGSAGTARGRCGIWSGREMGAMGEGGAEKGLADCGCSRTPNAVAIIAVIKKNSSRSLLGQFPVLSRLLPEIRFGVRVISIRATYY
jgi:hypothetical protein